MAAVPKAPLLVLSRLLKMTNETQLSTFRHLSGLLFRISTEALCEERTRQILICQEFSVL
jgi:hypothetical protein